MEVTGLPLAPRQQLAWTQKLAQSVLERARTRANKSFVGLFIFFLIHSYFCNKYCFSIPVLQKAKAKTR